MNALDALYIPLAAVTAPWWARKTRSGWGERFGHIEPLPAKAPGMRRVLLHAVSVGEVGTLRGLVPLLRERGCEVVVSASTDTGLKRARELFAGQPGVFVVRFALDFSPAVGRFLDAVRPDVVALVELEVWPNFVGACVRRGIPVGVINGRLSERSFRGYHRLRWFFGRTFSSLAFVGAQDADYAARFAAMGVPESRLSITASMKWDATAILEPGSELPGASELAKEMGIDRARPLIVAGSTAPMPGAGPNATEDAVLHAAVPKGVQLLTAPRRPEHREAAFVAMGGAGSCVRRSARAAAPPGTERFLLDTIGELRQAYALADVVVIGRTFDPKPGGSDPIEAISLGKATVIGPYAANFRHVVKLFRDADAIVVTDAESLGATLRALLNDPQRRAALAARGAACIRSQQGATVRHAELIMSVLRSSAKP
jgi:3-deoxy-D-manno-octulosonic-acid transferase